MSKAKILSKRIISVCLLVFGLMLCWSIVIAGDFYVIPLGKKATGNATTDEVLKNRTFSNSYATGLRGTRPHAPVEKTGQASARVTGDDGDLKKGIHWPVPRFTAATNVVIDNLTRLMWQRSLTDGNTVWSSAIDYCNGLVLWYGDPIGTNFDDWRLPNIKELLSLVDRGSLDPALPTLDPFNNVQSFYYWSSTSYAPLLSDTAWVVDFTDGSVDHHDKVSYYKVWCVRGGN
ncbi:MAG: DUF1566 domain-containing protein [Deltaproteobacteria bacterium]|nr:DUF1566 domain-containing protein [Deltaproteobacteria bacterium]